MYTKHAQKRLQQRGIPPFIIDLLLDFGECQHQKGGDILYFNTKSKKQLHTYLGQNGKKLLSEYSDIYAVVSDGTVITCGHRDKHIKRH